jgi:hypothetical protein
MPFSEPLYSADHIEEVRKIGRIATLLNELRAEYEARRRIETLDQMLERINELCQLRAALGEALEADRHEHEESAGLASDREKQAERPSGAPFVLLAARSWLWSGEAAGDVEQRGADHRAGRGGVSQQVEVQPDH